MSHGVWTLLLAAVAGYWVLERAETHKGDLRRVGKGLGWLIIIVSLVGVACTVWRLAKYKMGSCPLPMMGGHCLFPSQTAPAP